MKKGMPAETSSISRDMKILNKHGIHARPASLFIKTVNRFDSEITVEKDGTCVSGNSIMGLLTLEVYQGSTLRVHASGPDAEAALAAIEELVNNKFDEE